MKIREFKDLYPKWDMSFLATNMPTATEKACGLKMHLLYNHVDKKEYQCFSIPENYYNELSKRLDRLAPKQYVVMSVNGADFYLQRQDSAILGVCKQTLERVAISMPISLVIEEDEEAYETYENYMDGLGGDWQG